MNAKTKALLAEHSSSKVAALFENAAQAGEVARVLRSQLALEESQVQIITPGDPAPGRKMEPESQGILATIIKAHLRLGLAGLFVGVVAWVALRFVQTPFVMSWGVLSFVVLAGFGMTFGLFAGGLISLRPDHDPLLFKMREGLDAGRTAVVVHPFDSEQKSQAGDMLARFGGEVVGTL